MGTKKTTQMQVDDRILTDALDEAHDLPLIALVSRNTEAVVNSQKIELGRNEEILHLEEISTMLDSEFQELTVAERDDETQKKLLERLDALLMNPNGGETEADCMVKLGVEQRQESAQSLGYTSDEIKAREQLQKDILWICKHGDPADFARGHQLLSSWKAHTHDPLIARLSETLMESEEVAHLGATFAEKSDPVL